MSLLLRQHKIALAWSLVAIAGAVAGWSGYGARRDQLQADLLDETKRSAVGFDASELQTLSGTPADLATPAHALVRSRLQNLRAASGKNRAAYLLRYAAQTHRVIFLATSAPSGSAEDVAPGSEFAPAGAHPIVLDVIRSGQPASAGPFNDLHGTWATGYAPVAELTSGRDTGVRDILGLDVEASQWMREEWLAAGRRALYAWVLFGLPLGVWIVIRRQVEQREVIRNLSEAMEQSHSALAIVDLGARIEYANRGLCRQTGYSRRELIGHDCRDFRVPETHDDIIADLVATVRAGKSWEGEGFNRRKDGTIFPVRGVVTPVKHRDGSLACFVAVFDDVTEGKRREAELLEARDLAEAGDRAKSHFLATMSHEVRTPLNGIVGFTSLLLDTDLSPEQRDYVQTIRASGEALIQLTGDILDFARIESGKLKLDPLACDPRECMEDALDLLAAKAAEKNLELLHRVERDVPAAVVTDGGRLRQILVNLVGNAVKFTEAGEVEVSVRVLPPGSAESQPVNSPFCHLEFSVRDTGIGIAPDHHPKLFKPFSQLDDSSTRRYAGTGLGLAICRNLVKLLGGEIGMVSTPRQGTTFRFTIRAEIAAPPPDAHDMGGLRLGLAVAAGSLRTELGALAESWGTTVLAVDSPAKLAGAEWDVALVDVSEPVAALLAPLTTPLPGLVPARTFGLVPISLSSELRQALRTHFRLLVNKPVHHEALFGLLSGASPRVPARAPAPTHFGFRILIVEDNLVNQRLSSRVLENLGCICHAVSNGRQALDELSGHSDDYDVVLLDFHMPEMDGITALEEIRAGHAGPRAQMMWVIALTADARADQRARALAAGINDYLTKPLKTPELEAALRRFRSERVGAKR